MWESAFSGAYITPLLTGLNGHLQTANTQIVNDDRLETTPAMWSHRTRVTIEHLTHELNEKSQDNPQGAAPDSGDKQHQVLQMFLHEVQFIAFLMEWF
ncbi:hypothetical protein NP493_621g02030 [Ridgeia piscesae]|uniref:Uncharacterized protein n=1 Tax=Ridgeia piscesae TaxID=27915 RepID=A0AAD9NRQ7_RIDPI|nr:hypothetical protein NP493_621g02030 [Ridgeia piscesae]